MSHVLDPVKTMECKKKKKDLASCICDDQSCSLEKGRVISNSELLELDVDVLVPAALENVITKENASKIKAKYLIEMANGPTSTQADEILHKNGTLVVPDILANAGGVSTSYFEWVQNLQGMTWDKQEVISELGQLMVTAFENWWQVKKSTKTDGRTAAYIGAVKQVIDVMMTRGMV